MNRTLIIAISLVAALCAAPPAMGALEDGELSLLGAASTGDYGTGTDNDAGWFTVRYVTGSDFQFRVDVSMIHIETASGVTHTGLGPTPMGDQNRSGRGDPTGSLESSTLSSSAAGAPPAVMEDTATSGLGDLRMAVSRRMLGGGVKLFRLDANAEVKIPTAEESLGTGEWDYRVGLAGEYRFWSSTAFGGLGWNLLGDPAWVNLDDVLDGHVGIDSDPVAGERLIVSGWLEGWQEAVEAEGHRAALGLELRTTGRLRWRLQVTKGLTDASEDFGVMFGVSFGVSPAGPSVRGPQR